MSFITVKSSKKTEEQNEVVLIIDDNPTNLGVVVESLEQSGFKIIIARNGETGLKRAKFATPDIILLDVVMPGISGFEVCHRLKADESTINIPVIFMTALDSTEDKVKGFEMGGVDYITKPVQVEEVLARLRTHLTIHKLQNVNKQNKLLKQEIAKRKQLEEELRRSKEIADSANRAKSAFLANMSHELRTPLNGILGYAQIFNRDKSLSDKQKEWVQIIQRSGEHLLSLINDVLDLSKIEADKLELVLTSFHLPNFIKGITDLFKMQAAQKNIELIYEPLSKIPTAVRADEKRLRQVLHNLLSNAIKFTQQGQVYFKVNYQQNLEENTGMICFEVEDSGAGISSDNIETIFLPFQQVGEQSHQVEGTGLGLPISKKLVQMMGGNLQVQSIVGIGSHFWFLIPLQETYEIFKSNYEKSSTIIGFQNQKAGNSFKILVVDDKWENRLVLTELFIPLGFNVVEVKNGQDALTKAYEFQPDAIIMDIKMPVMDGLECTKRLRQDAKFNNTVIIALSAHAFDFQQQEAFEAGCNAYLNKPINVDKFLNKLAELCQLEWIYETYKNQNSNLPSTVPSSNMITPAPKQTKALFEAARMGNVKAVINKAEALLENNPSLEPFVQEVCLLAKNFKITELKIFLEQYLK